MDSDEVLLKKWRSGDSKAGHHLFARYYQTLDDFFERKANWVDAQELVQETLTACVAGRDRIRDGGTFRSYLFGIARNKLFHWIRRRYRCPEHLLSVRSILDLTPGPVSLIGRRQREHSLLMALQRLPLKMQVMLELHYWEGMSSAEIQHVLEMPAPTIRTWIVRARRLLEDAMVKERVPPEEARDYLQSLDAWAEDIRKYDAEGNQPRI